jgi:hypothetical protein
MTSKQIARVDGLPVSLIARERIWPVPDSSSLDEEGAVRLSAAQRARVARRSAGVHECRLPRLARRMVAEMAEWAAEQERIEIRLELRQAGLL